MATFEELKDLDIVSVAEALGLEPARRGNHYRVRCWNASNHSHGDRTPSITLHNNRFKCWVCEELKGNTIKLVMAVQGCDFQAACAWLEDRFFNGSFGGRMETELKPRTLHVDIPDGAVPEIHKEIYAQLMHLASTNSSNAGDLYLSRRGIDPKVAAWHGVRCVSEFQTRYVVDRLLQSFSPEDLWKAGVINDKGNFRFCFNRLLIPFYDGTEIVYVQGRSLDHERQALKYLNSGPHVPCLYNVNALLDEFCTKIVLCEGAIDTLTLLSRNVEAVGILGVDAFKERWIPLFQGKQIVLAMDEDQAGKRARKKLAKMFSDHGLTIRGHLKLEEGKDVNDTYAFNKVLRATGEKELTLSGMPA